MHFWRNGKAAGKKWGGKTFGGGKHSVLTGTVPVKRWGGRSKSAVNHPTLGSSAERTGEIFFRISKKNVKIVDAVKRAPDM